MLSQFRIFNQIILGVTENVSFPIFGDRSQFHS